MQSNLFVIRLLLIFFIALPVLFASPKFPARPKVHAIKKINLNKADVKTLTHSFARIGKKRAAAIVSYRQKHGKFKTVASLEEVHGLGKHFIKSHLTQLQQVFSVD